MTEMSRISVARPYAKAAFEYAVKEQALDRWSVLLKQVASILKERLMQVLVGDPRFDRMVAYECLCMACECLLFPAGENFLRLIALHQRLLVLPEIFCLFGQYCAEQANCVAVFATSALPLTPAQAKTLALALGRRLQQQVTLDYRVNPDLLGGLVVQIGDLVMDSSVRGKLERLRTTLLN